MTEDRVASMIRTLRNPGPIASQFSPFLAEVADTLERLTATSAANKLLYSSLHMEDTEIDKALSSNPTTRDAFYSILKNYIPGESIDQAWQELREAGLVP